MQICPMLEKDVRAAAERRRRDIRGVQHDERTLPTQLQAQALHRVYRRAHDRLTRGGRSGRGHHANLRVRGERRACDQILN
jgi:hypothetical protein